MAASGLHGMLPYAVNFSIVVTLVVVGARKPLKKFVFQRHGRIKDFVEDSARAHKRAVERAESAKRALSQLDVESRRIKDAELDSAKREAAEILSKAEDEAARVRKEAEMIMAAESTDQDEKVKEEFLNRVIARAESKLQGGLRSDDHAQIVRRARSSIEVGV